MALWLWLLFLGCFDTFALEVHTLVHHDGCVSIGVLLQALLEASLVATFLDLAESLALVGSLFRSFDLLLEFLLKLSHFRVSILVNDGMSQFWGWHVEGTYSNWRHISVMVMLLLMLTLTGLPIWTLRSTVDYLMVLVSDGDFRFDNVQLGSDFSQLLQLFLCEHSLLINSLNRSTSVFWVFSDDGSLHIPKLDLMIQWASGFFNLWLGLRNGLWFDDFLLNDWYRRLWKNNNSSTAWSPWTLPVLVGWSFCCSLIWLCASSGCSCSGSYLCIGVLSVWFCGCLLWRNEANVLVTIMLPFNLNNSWFLHCCGWWCLGHTASIDTARSTVSCWLIRLYNYGFSFISLRWSSRYGGCGVLFQPFF